MNERQEKLLNRVQQNARIGLAARMAEREDAIITRLVVAYRSGRLDPNMLFGGIAAIAELRAIATEAEQDLLRGTDAAAAFTIGESP